MAYPRPPRQTRSGIITNAAPFTLQTSTLINAPGVVSALRIVDMWFSTSVSNTGAIESSIQSSTPTLLWTLDFVAGADKQHLPLPEPGLQIELNQRLELVTFSNVASQTIWVTILYYIDDVT